MAAFGHSVTARERARHTEISSRTDARVPPTAADDEGDDERTITVRLEKSDYKNPSAEPWRGVLRTEQPTALSYDEERGEFDVREYVEMMGGINMSLVDKTMFTVDKLAPDAKREFASGIGAQTDPGSGLGPT